MVAHKEFTAWITVEGKPVQEYSTSIEENGRKATCYIASEEGQTFQVNWRDNGSKTFTSAYISCDGYTVPGRYLHGAGQTMRGGVRCGPNTERPFMFAEIPRTAHASPGERKAKEIGTIVLSIVQVQRGPTRSANKFQVIPSTVSNDCIPTTGGHCAAFSKEEVHVGPQHPWTWSSKPMDGSEPHSYVKFTWNYRPFAVLQAQGITARPSAPPITTPPRHWTSAPQAVPMPVMVPGYPYPAPPGATKGTYIVPPVVDYTARGGGTTPAFDYLPRLAAPHGVAIGRAGARASAPGRTRPPAKSANKGKGRAEVGASTASAAGSPSKCGVKGLSQATSLLPRPVDLPITPAPFVPSQHRIPSNAPQQSASTSGSSSTGSGDDSSGGGNADLSYPPQMDVDIDEYGWAKLPWDLENFVRNGMQLEPDASEIFAYVDLDKGHN